jgi:hypothetical protein
MQFCSAVYYVLLIQAKLFSNDVRKNITFYEPKYIFRFNFINI